MDEKNGLLSVKDASLRLRSSEQHVRSLIRNEEIPAMRIGKQWIINLDDLESYIHKSGIVIEPEDHARNDTEIPEFVALSFFAGAMGLDLGMEKAGISPLLVCEFDKSCRKTIAANRPDISLIGDILEYSAEDIRRMARIDGDTKIDLIYGGPPCQAFSTAGKRKGFDDPRGNVFLKFIDLIIELLPEYVVIENVRGLLSAPVEIGGENVKGGALMQIWDLLTSAGYSMKFNLYNAANFGAPQIRERIVLIGHRGDPVPYLEPTHSENGEYELPKWKTFRDALEGLEVEEHHHVDFPEDRLKYYRMLEAGQYWKHLPEDLQKEALGNSYYLGGGKTGFLRRLSFEKPSPTLVTHPAMPATDLAHPIEDRPISVEEYSRIQGFPDDWVICGKLIDQYRQIGNAVPVALGEAIGKAILRHRRGENPKAYEGFKYSRYKNTDEIAWMSEFKKIYEKTKGSKQTTLLDIQIIDDIDTRSKTTIDST